MRLRDEKKAGTLLLAVLLLTGCGGAADTASNVGTDAAVDTVMTAPVTSPSLMISIRIRWKQ